MISFNKAKMVLKMISVMVAGVFLWQQITWAGEPVGYHANTITDNGHVPTIPGTSQEGFQIQKNMKESLITGKQEIEDSIKRRDTGKCTDKGIAVITTDAEGVKRAFDSNGKLISIELNDREETKLTFKDDGISKIETNGAILEDISFDPDGNIDFAKLIKADGSEYFFADSAITAFISGEDVEFEIDEAGKITELRRKNTGESFNATHSTDLEGIGSTIFTSTLNGTKYVYKNGLLSNISDTAGLEVNYEYNGTERPKKIEISYSGTERAAYSYEYAENETVITDDLGNKRTYNGRNEIVRSETPYGETYLYAHDTGENGERVTTVNYASKYRNDGVLIEYLKGNITRITRPDGSWIDNVEFDNETRELKGFVLHSVNGKQSKVIIEGKFVQFVMPDHTRLIFHEDRLVAYACSNRIVSLYDIEGLDSITLESDNPSTGENEADERSPVDDLYYRLGISRDLDLLDGEGEQIAVERDLKGIARALADGPSGIAMGFLFHTIKWEVETGDPHKRGINSVYREVDKKGVFKYKDILFNSMSSLLGRRNSTDLIVNTRFSSTNSANSEGEIYFDVRKLDAVWDKPMNLTVRPIRMEIAVPQGMKGSRETPNTSRLFVEDIDGNRQYGPSLALSGNNGGCQMEIIPTFGEIPSGFTDDGFDPSKIIKIGVNIAIHPSSKTDFEGQIRLSFAAELSFYSSGKKTGNMSSYMDSRHINGYLADKHGNPVNFRGRKTSSGFRRYLQKSRSTIYGDGSIMADINQLIAEIPSCRLPDDLAAFSVYDKHGKVSHITRPTGMTTWFDENGNTDHITLENGDIFVDYTYDKEGDLTCATMVNARERLVSSVKAAVSQAENKIEDALLLLEEEKKLMEEDLMNRASEAKGAFSGTRREIGNQRYQRLKHNTLGFIWYQTIENPGAGGAIAEINRQEADFDRQIAEQLAMLEAQVRAKKELLWIEKEKILEEYARQEKEMLLSIIKKEAIPVIHYYYRKALGRDAGQEEMLTIFRRIDADNGFDGAALKPELMSLSEYQERMRFKEKVTDSVMTFLKEYCSNPGSRETFLAALGLSEDEAIDTSGNFLGSLEKWLEGQDIHFGRSAFGALMKMLDDKGIDVPLEEIAKEAVLIDIFSGASVPQVDKRLEISMFAMRRVLALHGLEADNVRLEYNDILEIKSPFVTLINTNHYITVLSVTMAEVTYWEQNLGADGGIMTVSRREFEDNWHGNVITTEEIHGGRILRERETKKIKGAFFGCLIAAVVSGIITALGAVVTVAVNAIAAVVATLGTLIGQITVGLVQAVLNAGSVLCFAGKVVMGALGINGMASAAMSGFSLDTLVHGAATALINIGVNYGASVGLEALGVDPVVSGIVSSMVTGGVHGFLSDGSLTGIFKSAVRFGVFTGTSLLGRHFDLEPVITGIMSLTATTLTGAGLDPGISFEEALKAISARVAGDLSYYGVRSAGNAMGINPSLSYLAGIGIGSSLRAGLGTFGAGGLPEKKGFLGRLLEGLWQGLRRGGTNIGLSHLNRNMRMDPLTSNAVGLALGGGINGLFKGDPVRGVVDAYGGAMLNAASFGLAGRDPITGEIIAAHTAAEQNAVYISSIMEITDSLKRKGLQRTLRDYSAEILRYETVDAFAGPGGVYDIIEKRVLSRNKTSFRIRYRGKGVSEIIDRRTGEIIGKYRKNGNVITLETGKYKVDPENGEKNFTAGRITQISGNNTAVYEVEDGKVKKMTLLDEKNDASVILEGMNGNAIDKENYKVVGTSKHSAFAWSKEVEDGQIMEGSDKNLWEDDTPEARYKKDYKENYGKEIIEEGWKQYREPPDDNDDNSPPSNIETLLARVWDQMRGSPSRVLILPRI